jgi:dCTP deaminase
MSLRIESTDEADTPPDESLRGVEAEAVRLQTGIQGKAGLLPRQEIRELVRQGAVLARAELKDSQFQPASLDLRLGAKAYRVRASFLPGGGKTVAEKLTDLKFDEVNLEDGAVLERGCVYVVELLEHLALPASISAMANPKSSTGRLDVFTRLIADRSEAFDSVAPGYRGKLYAEVSPGSFSIKVRKGSRLNQIRFRRRTGNQDYTTNARLTDKELRELHSRVLLVDGELKVRHGLILHIELGGMGPERLVGYRAQRHTDLIDVDNVAGYRFDEFWEPIRARGKQLILDPNEFYILASKEKLHIPPDMAAEMVPIDPTMGEFRVPLRRLLRPRLRLHGSRPPRQPGRPRGSQPRGALRARRWPDGLPPRIRAHGGDPRRALRPDRHLQLPGPGAQAFQALPDGLSRDRVWPLAPPPP